MNRLDCLIAGALLLAPCSCQREAPSAAGEPATEPVMTIDESLQQYGLELMRKKEGVLLATDPATGAVLASIVKGDRADSLRLAALAERFSSEAARGGSPDEVEDMWRDVNGAPGTGSRLWVAHADGLDICGRAESLDAAHPNVRPAFIGFAPKDSPRIVVVSYVKGRSLAARFSAPIGSLMIERYLNGATSRPELESRMISAGPLYPRIPEGPNRCVRHETAPRTEPH